MTGPLDFSAARAVADAVLYEGYVLYPYRLSAQKNRVRWQFGVLVPRAQAESGWPEPWYQQTECLVEGGRDPVLHLQVRFLQVQSKEVEERDPLTGSWRPVPSLEVEGSPHFPWDEGVEREVEASVPLAADGEERVVPFGFPAGEEVEPLRSAEEEVGRVVRRRWDLQGVLRVRAEPAGGPFGALRLRVRTENVTPWAVAGAEREEVLRRSFVATHTVLGLADGAFVSLLDPPEWARPLVEACRNEHTFPVLVGEEGRRDLLLSSPIILYDYPQVAPESPGDLFDATEIDELLLLRTMTLTEEEKREARATDPRAAAVIERAEHLPPDVLERLHGAVRYLRTAAEPEARERAPWWDPGEDASVSPETDAVEVAGVRVARGSRVRLRPGARPADAQDMFVAGRTARVEAVFFDVDGRAHLAVALEDDPGADLAAAYGRYLYFAPDEVEPLEGAGEDP
ncbi:MAG TPA: hypothetical protein VNO34_02775 [Actinomycetota bacterium]|nr:hypothetical protein [Actinomycetota bacterium]